MSVKFLSNAAREFDGANLLQIAMPMGGIGAGCICLNGEGGLQDFSIRNKPSNSAMPGSHRRGEAGFALLRIAGDDPVTRLVEGPMPAGKIYNLGLNGHGCRDGGHEGLPRFEHCRFVGEYPFGHVHLKHSSMPIDVSVTGFSPFIPLDDRHSSMPVAILEYTLNNPTNYAVDYEFSYHLSHLALSGEHNVGTRNHLMDNFGVFMNNTEDPNAEAFGSAALGVIGHEPKIKAMWPRGGWFDWNSALWREVSSGRFTENAGNADKDMSGGNGGSIMLAGRLEPGESVTYPIVIAWHFPNCNLTRGQPKVEGEETKDCGCGEGETCPPKWRPYYAGQWADARKVAEHVRDQYQDLRGRTRAFRDALASSSVPDEVIEAMSSNLAILKSPTVLRQENGNVWAWEGCFCTAGCCNGSCTHVWNYAQALPHLYPALERTLREQELLRSMDEKGHINFRSAIPDGPTDHNWHPASDGQLGGIMKLYRDWQISGDNAWLKKILPAAKKSLAFCIDKWDPDRKGALIEPHHNTYDIEFWGPDGMCTSIYISALSAMAAMCEAMGDKAEAAEYQQLAERGAAYMDEHLFNGEYYQQNVMWSELRDQSFAEVMAKVHDDSPDIDRIQKAEGPKYQYGSGCLSDGVIGAWMAKIYGIDTPITADHVRQTLAAIYEYNFREDLFDHVCTQRPGYAIGHEAGLILCTWPGGDHPTLPFVYSDEVWTGIEYQVASHLIAEGMVDEGLNITRGARSRYEGDVRNPFNEYECGSYYARALASYALLPAWAGLRYSAVTRTLHLDPKGNERPFRTFVSTETGWGTLTLDEKSLAVELIEGELALDEVVLGAGDAEQRITAGIIAKAGAAAEVSIK